MNPAPSKYSSFLKALTFGRVNINIKLNKKEGAG